MKFYRFTCYILSDFSHLTDTQKLTILTAQLADDKLAQDVFILELKEIDVAAADYFVVATCESNNQVQAITNLILEKCVEYELKKPRIEGIEQGEWVILDFFDVVIHLFIKEVRAFYKIEKLWGDAKFYTVDLEGDMHTVTIQDVLQIYNNYELA